MFDWNRPAAGARRTDYVFKLFKHGNSRLVWQSRGCSKSIPHARRNAERENLRLEITVEELVADERGVWVPVVK